MTLTDSCCLEAVAVGFLVSCGGEARWICERVAWCGACVSGDELLAKVVDGLGQGDVWVSGMVVVFIREVRALDNISQDSHIY